MMYKIRKSDLNKIFDAIKTQYDLYVMATTEENQSAALNEISKGDGSHSIGNTTSIKNFFLPKTENIAKFKFIDKKIDVTEDAPIDKPFIVFGARACDLASLKVLDEVYLNMSPVDSYYKARRENGIIISKACNPSEIKKSCFCASSSTATSQLGFSAANPESDITTWEIEEEIFFKTKTEKGEKLMGFLDYARNDSMTTRNNGETDNKEKKSPAPNAMNEEENTPHSIITTATEEDNSQLSIINSQLSILNYQPLAPLFDTTAFRARDMLTIFNSPIWNSLSATCLGCGSCTYVCPTCMCFDIRDYKSGNKVQRYRTWDSCMFSDFTQMAADNPRKTQKERFRQRFMHKLTYYPLAHNDITSCVGCGRCVEACPINMNIVKVAMAYNEAATKQPNQIDNTTTAQSACQRDASTSLSMTNQTITGAKA